MVLNKIIKPLVSTFSREKWKSRNSRVRKKAVQELPVSDQQIIADIALNDLDESIRIVAINKSNDLDLLQTIIMKGTNLSVKQTAETRFHQLLSGIKHPIPDYTEREKIIIGSRNPALLDYIAEHAIEPEFRKIAIKRINRDALLGNIALKDANADVRLTAAQQIAKRSTLERVVKQSRRKDKRVYKTVKNKLDHIIEDEERPFILAKEVEDICYQLERLYKRGRLQQEKPTYENYLKRWESIKNFASETTLQRFELASQQIAQGLAKLEEEQNRKQQTIQNLEKILGQVTDTVDELLQARNSQDSDSISHAEATLNSLGQAWDEAISGLSLNEAKHFNSRFQTLLELTESLTLKQENLQSTQEKMLLLCSQLESMLSSEGYIRQYSIDALNSKFHSQLKLLQQHTPEIEPCINTFEQSLSSLRERLSIQNQKAEELKKFIQSNLKQIQLQIDEGQISKAEKNRNNLFNQIENSHFLSGTEKQQYQKSLNSFRSELGKLSSWRNWAHENEREHLAQQAEQLLIDSQQNSELETNYPDYVAQIKTMRQEWKRLKSPSSDKLWERFNTACSQSYELCTPFLNQEAEERKKHLVEKEAFCEQLEQYISSMHWPTDPETEIDSSVDWRKVDQVIHQARKEWNSIGYVDRKSHKSITTRFDNNINIIRTELKKVWQKNHTQYERLINQVTALHELLDTDLDQAIEKAKSLQNEWKKIGPVPSYQRNKLWKKFRKSCDLIFDKRQEIIDQRNQDNEFILSEKQAVCENFEALNQQPLPLTDLQNAYNDIAKLWNELEPKLKSSSKEINQRYAAAKKVYASKLEHLMAEKSAQQLELFKQKAQLCTRLERLPSSETEEMGQITDSWNQLPTLPAKMENLIKTRFDNALEHVNDDKSLLIKAEEEEKQQLCLKYEILCGKDSPEDQSQARRQMQVELLKTSMSGRRSEEEKPDPMDMQIKWHSLSNYEFEGDAEIDERFSRLV